MRAAGRARADTVNERIAADGDRGEQRKADRAAIEPGEIASPMQ
jgi:hypothetical protein